ncbi:MAG: TrmH family RNA methyltransferase [Clostridiales bacterium]|nr:TrmH family RNA methyltransferase [Clostridiales bacterium]
MPKLEPYDRSLPYSYALGVFPALKLLSARPDVVTRLLLSPAGGRNEGVARLREMCAALGIREEEAERVLRRESRKENCFAALVFDKYQPELSADRPHAVLCQVSDAGNLGSALRSCLAFGVRDVAVIRPAADLFEPHTLRASMGAFFGLRARAFDSFGEYRAAHPDHALYPFMLDGGVPLEQAAADRPEKYGLVFGNEQSGLPPEFAALGRSVFIPQSDEVDSLNLAAAVAIGVYTFAHGEPNAGGGR